MRTSLTVTEALAADTAGYARALAPRPFHFPDDHGPHPDFRTEWWYYTGNLSTSRGRQFGYQLTMFRIAVQPPPAPGEDPEDDSTWSTRQLYMAHFALSDARAGTFGAFERFSRGAAGLAGASAAPYRVWLEDWEISGESADSVRLRAREDAAAIDLSLLRLKPIVLQGREGLDAKGPQPGNASYYYSMTRMRTTGSVRIDGESFDVEGLSWLDREWSTSALGEDLEGWDWFSLHLDDGRDVMYYRLRTTDGGASRYSTGSVVDVDGSVRRLEPDDVAARPIRMWESPESGSRYPVAWALRIPSMDIDLEIEPTMDRQELALAVTYWEGAVRVRGSHEGSGFLEMTGYGHAVPGGN